MKHIFAAITLILLSLAVFAEQPALDSNHSKLPPLTLNMADGTNIKTQELLGQPYVLHFWATWCPYCKKLQPALQKIHNMGLNVIAVSFKEDDNAFPAKALTNRGYTFKTAIQADEIATQLGIRGTPTTLFINENGHVVWVTHSSNPDNTNLYLNARTLINSINTK
ncbi:TlpA family protein disulfide reductase [Pseudoalteromonas sp. CR1]|uniref:TlpA disulfide reductase family protein n=1 Tax=Pseudoalteromonas sp. CR1 TaxID=2861964 RepID=UPI001C5DA851|nr:TlpA disulfide reductase family protein [Pseudoalteromonas sp. CR1]MBW4966315.1 TlpA family protein disulfide reductase [Pseudoalteromonas sp. CR1]